jgi:hypothetical protein
LEQTNVAGVKPESASLAGVEGKNGKAAFDPKKKKKTTAKDFLHELASSLAGAGTKNGKTSLTDAAGSLAKKMSEAAKKATALSGHSPGILVTKIHARKTLHVEKVFPEKGDKSEKLKNLQKKAKKRIAEHLVPGKHDFAEKQNDVKKPGADNDRVHENKHPDHRVNARDHSTSSKRTIVIDLRKPNDASQKSAGTDNLDNQGTQLDGRTLFRVNGFKGGETAYFGSGLAGREGQLTSGGTEGKRTGSHSGDSLGTFRDILHNELISNTRFILKNGGNGELQIELKPESLGKLKFKVSLDNNRIEGKIFVENSNVKEMVEQSMQNLSNALLDEGFDSVNLQVALGGDNRGDRETGDGSQLSERHSLDFERAASAIDYFDAEERLVDVVI